MDVEPCGSAPCEHARLGGLFNGHLQLEKYFRGTWMYQVDFPEEDTISGLGASEHEWEGHTVCGACEFTE